MHDGFKIFDMDTNVNDHPSILLEYRKHDSLAYGVDWLPLRSGDSKTTNQSTAVSSCSFYDNAFHMWTTNAV